MTSADEGVLTGELAGFVPDRRLEALHEACVLYQGTREAPFVVLRAAEQFLKEWLAKRPHKLVLILPRFTFRQGNPAVAVPTHYLGDGMSVTMTDDQQVTYSGAAASLVLNPGAPEAQPAP